jgi:antitoxin component YwqK of YwqJK toxin-antitoxin module
MHKEIIWYTQEIGDTPEHRIIEYYDPNTHEVKMIETFENGKLFSREDLRIRRGLVSDYDEFSPEQVLVRSKRLIPGTNTYLFQHFSEKSGNIQVEEIFDVRSHELISATRYVYHNGKLAEKVPTDKLGLRSGFVEYFTESGELYKTTEFRNGIPEGLSVDYRSEGFPVSSLRTNELGEPVSVSRFNKLGNKI